MNKDQNSMLNEIINIVTGKKITSNEAGLLNHAKKRRKKYIRQRITTVLAAIMVFVVTYAMILPAITMTKADQTLACAYETHVHTDACYRDVIDENGNVIGKELICGQADWTVHEHTDDCFAEITDADGNVQKILVCDLPEIKEHRHDASCYQDNQVLICGKVESAGHTHTETCYSIENVLTCSVEEHVHDNSCYQEVVNSQLVLVCGNEDPEHVHDDSCYAEQQTTERVLVCDKEEHQHGAECYEEVRTLTCGMEEAEEHHHDASCYKTQKVLVCGQIELHTHTKDCYEKDHENDPAYLICGKTELKAHTHGAGCLVKGKASDEEIIETADEASAMRLAKAESLVSMSAFESTPIGVVENETAVKAAVEKLVAELTEEESDNVILMSEEDAEAVEGDSEEQTVFFMEEDGEESAERESVDDSSVTEGDDTDESVDTADDEDTEADESAEDEDSKDKDAEETAGSFDSLTYEDDAIKVTATPIGEEIPDGAELVVTQITPATEGYNYDAYMDALQVEGNSVAFSAENTLLFDVAIMIDDTEYEPAEGSIKLELQFKNNNLAKQIGAEKASELYLYHLPIDDFVREQYASTKEAIDIDVADINTEAVSSVIVEEEDMVSFELSSLSTIAVSSGTANVDITTSLPDGYTYYLAISGPDNIKKIVALSAKGTATVNLPRSGEYSVELYIPKAGQETNCADDASKNDYNNLIQNHGKKLEAGSLLFGGYVLNMNDVTVTDTGSLSISLTLPQQKLAVDFNSLMDHAKAYGVVADSYKTNSNIRTNFATKKLEVQNENTIKFRNRVQDGTAVPYIIGEFSNSSSLKFTSDYNGEYYIQQADTGHVSTSGGQIETVRNKEELIDKVDLLITRTINQAADLANPSNNMASVGYLPSDSELDLTAFADNTTITLDATGLVHGNDATKGLVLKKKPGQKIVFNMYGNDLKLPYDVIIEEYDDNGNLLAKYDANDFGNDDNDKNNKFTSAVADAWKKIIWNIPEATSMQAMKGKLAGVYLIQNPNSYVQIDNGAGWIVSAGKVENQNHWYAFPAADVPFEQITVKKVFVGVDKASDITDKDNFYILLETYANAQSGGTSSGENATKFVLKNAVVDGGNEIKPNGDPEIDAANHTITYTWTSDFLAVGNEHKLTEYNAKAIPSGGSTAIDPIVVRYQTRIINLDNSVLPHVVRWHNNPEKDAENPDGNVTGTIDVAYGVLNVGNDAENQIAIVTNVYEDKSEHDLSVIKRVRGPESPENREYTFTITLTDENGDVPVDSAEYDFVKSLTTVTGGAEQSGKITFARDNGVYKATFTLSKDQRIVIKSLPKNWNYTITEGTSDDYTTTYGSGSTVSASGTMTWDKTETVTNTYQQPMENLIVTKTVNDKSLLPSTFKVTLIDSSDNSYSRELTTADAVETTADGTTVYRWEVEDVPIGDTFTVTESGWSVDGYQLTAEISVNGEDRHSASTDNTIEIAKGDNTVDLFNTYNPILAVSKVVSGSSSISSYQFKLKLWDENGTAVTDTINALTGQTLTYSSDGYVFNLTDGSNIAIVVEKGWRYAVTEVTEGDFETEIDREVLGIHDLTQGRVLSETVLNNPTQIQYTNTFSEPDGNLHARKVFKDEDGNLLGLKGNDFTFKVQTWDDTTKTAGADAILVANNNQSGGVKFNDYDFPTGTSWYLITENEPTEDNIVAGGERYLAKVEKASGSSIRNIQTVTCDYGQKINLSDYFNASSAGTYRILTSKNNAWSAFSDINSSGGRTNFSIAMSGVNKGTYTYYLALVNGWTVEKVEYEVSIEVTNVRYDPSKGQNIPEVGDVTIKAYDENEGSGTGSLTITYYALNTDNTLGESVSLPVFNNTKTIKQNIQILKVDSTDSTVKLENAVFMLEAENGDDLWNANRSTNGNGLLSLGELEKGTYYLHEITAPSGYRLPETRTKIVVSGDTVSAISEGGGSLYDVTKSSDGVWTITVPNTAEDGYVLPSTGGSGTKLFTIIGSILVVSAGILLIRRRRRV